MADKFSEMLTYLEESEKSDLLLKGNWGIERETHRINHNGDIATTPHPKCLTSDQVTLDFAETQLEFVTKTRQTLSDVIEELEAIHKRAELAIGDELMWPLSMPPRLPEDAKIPIAKFPDDKDGFEKELYRKGLAERYGKKLQMISGIHYNYSMSDHLINILYQQFKTDETKQSFINEIYMNIGRNVLKYRWLFIYLFGASPTVDPTYDSVMLDKLKNSGEANPQEALKNMNLSKYATSLRTSRFGYSTEVEDKYQVSHNHLDEYIEDVRKILNTENETYKEIGVERDGERIQINTNELQIEAEFYAPIRFRQTPLYGETLLDALEKRGISYFELRDVDINPFSNIGITKDQAEFIHLFILMCLFEENKGFSREEQQLANQNHKRVANYGRKPDLTLFLNPEEEVSLKVWGERVFKKIMKIASTLDRSTNQTYYTDIVEAEKRKLDDKSLLISDKMVNEMKAHSDSYLDFGLSLAQKYKQDQSKIRLNA